MASQPSHKLLRMQARRHPLRIGLTGGIGSGKSTVAQMLTGLGACVIDADAIAKRLTEAQGAAMPVIAAQFGAEFVNNHGALDRERMRTHVFTHAPAKAELEAIIHPLVAQEINAQAQAAVAQGFTTLLFDIPLLVESGRRWRAQIDRVLVIDCPVETQIQRVMARSQLTRETVEKIIAAQATRNQRLHAADWVIENEQVSLAELLQQVSALPIKSQAIDGDLPLEQV